MDSQTSMLLVALASAFGLWLLWTVASLQRDLSRLKKQVMELEAGSPAKFDSKVFSHVPSRSSSEGSTEASELATSMSESVSHGGLSSAPMSKTDPLPELDSLEEIHLPIDESKLGEIDFASVLDEDDRHSTQIKNFDPRKLK